MRVKGVIRMTDINTVRQAFASYEDRRVLAMISTGAYAHGLADGNSPREYLMVVAPTPDEILYGRASWSDETAAGITLLTPQVMLERLIAGDLTMLETLSAPTDLIVYDSGLLHELSVYAMGLGGLHAVVVAQDTVRALLRALSMADRLGLSEPRRHALAVEALRLTWSVRRLDRTGVWPCRLDVDDLNRLHEVARAGMPTSQLVRETEAFSLVPWRTPPADPASMRAARRVVSATLTRIVNGEHVGTTMPDALDMFHQWEAMR